MTPLWMNGVGPAVAAIGASDCERLGTGALAQPVNAATSLAFIVVAALVVALTRRGGDHHRASLVVAGLLGAVGVGSVAFHGPQPAGARIVHDLPIALTGLFVLAANLGSLGEGNGASGARGRAVAGIGGAAAVTALLVLVPDVGSTTTALLVLAAILTEVAVLRRGRRTAVGSSGRRSAFGLALLLALGAALFLLGRTTSPVCDPDALLQPHGLWHITAAMVLGLWWWRALGPGSGGSPAPVDQRAASGGGRREQRHGDDGAVRRAVAAFGHQISRPLR